MARAARWLRRAGRRSLFLTLRAFARAGGFRCAPLLGKVVGELEYRIAWRRSRRCAHDMALALGRPPGDPWVDAQLRRAHHVNGQAALEILAMLSRREEHRALVARAQIEGIEHLQAALASGCGAIVLGTHAGNGVLLAVLLAAAGFPITVVYRHARMMSDGFFAEGFARYGVDSILANEGIRAYGRMLKAVRAGRIVFITLDQGVKPGTGGVVVRFLGKDMAVPAGPAHLARHARTPVLPVMAAACDGIWRFRIEPPLTLAPGPLAADVERLARASERQMLLHPELWGWHHRRWHKQPFAHATMRAEPEATGDPTCRQHAP